MKYWFCTILIGMGILACGNGENSIRPVGGSPVITSPSAATAIEDSMFSYAATASDPDNDAVTITFDVYPGWMSVDGNDIGGITPWMSEQTYFRVIASDGSLDDSLVVLVEVEQSEVFYIGLRPRENFINTGDYATIVMGINSVEEMFAISFDIIFDSEVVVFESVYAPSSSILGAANSIVFSNPIPGGVSVSAGRTQTDWNDNISGRGSLLEIVFLGAGSGVTPVDIVNVLIVNEDGQINPDLANLIIKPSQFFIP